MIRLTDIPVSFGDLKNGTRVRVQVIIPTPTPRHATELTDGEIVTAVVTCGNSAPWSFYLAVTKEEKPFYRRYLFPVEYDGGYKTAPDILQYYAKAKILEVV